MATTTAPSQFQAPQQPRWRGPVTVLLVILAAVAGFAGAFLLTHKTTAPAPPAKLVKAKIPSGPTASQTLNEFTSTIAPLHYVKPKPKPKVVKHKKAATTSSSSSASSTGNTGSVAPAESTPVYTPPADSGGSTYDGGSSSSGGDSSGGSSSSGSSGSSGPSSSGGGHGGGVITIG